MEYRLSSFRPVRLTPPPEDHVPVSGGAGNSQSFTPMVDKSGQDWQLGKNVLECNKYMFENSIECDITFTFQPSDRKETNMEGQLLSAHKYVLISRSPVFFAMLAGPARDESGLVGIEDIDIDSFREMLR